MTEQRQWFGEMPVVADDGETVASMGTMLTRLMAERDAQADMIERLRAALDSMLDGFTPRQMADTIEANLGDPSLVRLQEGMLKQILQRRDALRALQPGDLGHFE